MLRSYSYDKALTAEHPGAWPLHDGLASDAVRQSMSLRANSPLQHGRHDYSSGAARHHGNCQPASFPNSSSSGTGVLRHSAPLRMDNGSVDSQSSTVSVTDTISESGLPSANGARLDLDDGESSSPSQDPGEQPVSFLANSFHRSPVVYPSAVSTVHIPAPAAASSALEHHVKDGLCVIFANERIEVGESFALSQGVANTTSKLKQVFLQDFNFTVFVHWNKTGCEMLDLAREARLDLEYKDGLFVFVLGTIDNGWVMGSDGIAFPLQDLIQMFGLSSESLPMFFCAHHFPLPSSIDRELLTDPPPTKEFWTGRDFISLIENQAFMWLQAPASVDEFVRLLKVNSGSKDLAQITNQFAEWTRRSGNVRSLRVKRTFSKLIYLVTPCAVRDI